MQPVRISSSFTSSSSGGRPRVRRSVSLYSSKVKTFINENDPNWMERFVEISNHLVFGDFDQAWFDEIYLDLLRDLCDDGLSEDFLTHLLALLEMMIPFLDSDEKIEQTAGSLLNLIQNFQHPSTKYSPFLQCKFINLLTTIVLFNSGLRRSSESIAELYSSFIKYLLKNLTFRSCSQCFHQLSLEEPDMLDECLDMNQFCSGQSLQNNNTLVMMLSYYSHKQNLPQLRQLIQNIRFSYDMNFYHLNTLLYRLICSNPETLSLMTLKPFIVKFISSNSAHNVHFALKLLIKFGFELFSSLEEEFFIKQLVSLATLPSLPIGFRLMTLSFIRTAFIKIYKPPLNSPPLNLINSLTPNHFDGADTLEKKLLILNEFSFVVNDDEFFTLIVRLHELSNSKNANFNRSTNSLFRILHCALLRRPQTEDRIKNFLLENIFTLTHLHYVEKCFSFLFHHRLFAQNFVDNFIAKLMLLSSNNDVKTSVIATYAQYCAFLEFFNWFLSIAHHDIKLTEFQIEFLVNFIRIHSSVWPQSSTKALSCCTSILYYQRVTPKVKDALLVILEWLKNEHKLNVETSSLAQIYLLALRTLKEEYIKQVFTSDEEEFLIQKIPQSFDEYLGSIVKIGSGESPLIIRRLEHRLEKQEISENNFFEAEIQFSIELDEECSIDKLFCVEVTYTSKQIGLFKQVFQFPIIEKGAPSTLKLNLTTCILTSFYLDVTVKFVDFQGTIYNFNQNQIELVPLSDIFIPLDVSDIDEIAKHPRLSEAFETVVCLEKMKSIEEFYETFPWIEQFTAESNCFMFGILPNFLLIGRVEIVNDFVNIFIVTDQPEIVGSLIAQIFIDSA